MKKIICIMISCIMLVTFIEKPCEAIAASSTVSNMKKDKGIKWLTGNMCFYVTTLYCMDDYKKNKKVAIKMDVPHKFDIAGTLADCKYNKINYEDQLEDFSGGRVLARLDMNFTSKLYKKLFRTKLVRPKLKKNSASLVCIDGMYYASLGDFGLAGPAYRIEKITKKGRGSYLINAKNLLRGEGKTLAVGTTWITVKKDKKASYGYKIVKCSYKIIM